MKKITITVSLIIIFIFIYNLQNIYKILPNKSKIVIKNSILDTYEGLNDTSKILIRSLKLEPFKELQKRYKREDPKIDNLNNDYNIKFLPQTQTDNLNLFKYKINFKKKTNKKNDSSYGFFKPFYIEIFNDHLLMINNNGEILSVELDRIINLKKNLNFKEISSNLKIEGNKNSKIMGTLIHEQKIYLSYLSYENNCQIYNISVAKLNFKTLVFENFFKSDSCGENLNAGRMKIFNFNGSKGLLATIGGEKLNAPTNNPQDQNSDIGKIIFINFFDKEKKIFTSGHRNPQGLYVENQLVIATEHGPQGGDEINKIIYKGNYGWPVASYGMHYDHVENKPKKSYLKSHLNNNFKEPIYSFVPSIGISEIIKVPDKFSKNWEDNFLLASLNGGSLYRIKFSKNFDRIIYKEKIFINRRIRDLKYSVEYNVIILALEDWKEIGILKQAENVSN